MPRWSTTAFVRYGAIAVLSMISLLCLGCSERREPEPTEPVSEGPSEAPSAEEPEKGSGAPEKAPQATPSAEEPAQPSIDLLRAVAAEVEASSAYRDDISQVERLCDGDLETAWNSKTGDLQGAWIAFEVPADAAVTGIEMTAGYTKTSGSSDLFGGNHRVKRVRVSRAGTTIGEFDLDVDSRELQRLPVTGGGGDYRIELIELVTGSRPTWREACVSELRVLGNAPGAQEGSRRPTFRIAAPTETTDAGAASDAGAGEAGASEAGDEVAPDDEAPAAPVPELLEADGLRLTQLATAIAVENATPVDPRGTFSQATDERVYCFVRLVNTAGAATKIYLAWERPGQPSSDRGREIAVPARPRFGTYAFLGTQNRTGDFQCVIRSEQGSLLGRIDFSITE